MINKKKVAAMLAVNIWHQTKGEMSSKVTWTESRVGWHHGKKI